MKALFKSQLLQDEFDQNGFVRIPFLTSAQVDELLIQYQSISADHDRIGLPFTTTSHSNSYELIQKADRQIAGIFAPEMDRVLTDYKLLFGNFLVKNIGPDSVTPLHQDTSFVDETRYSSVSVWVSLHDTDARNGCMRFIKGSHRFRQLLRPTHSFDWPFEGVRPQLEELLEDYPSQRGEAFIFHHGVIHASYPNLSDSARVAAVMAAYPSDADLLMYFAEKDDGTAIRRFRMTREDYLRFVKGEAPPTELLGTEKANYSPVTAAQLKGMTVPSGSLLGQLKDFFRRRSGLFSIT